MHPVCFFKPLPRKKNQCLLFKRQVSFALDPEKHIHTMDVPSTVLELRCAPIPLVRIALIGLGQRGMKTLERYAFIPDAEIRYIIDTDAQRLALANAALKSSGRPAAKAFSGAEAWKKVCDMEDVDLIYICTEWNSHCRMAVEAMKRGKHVAVEVPAARTVEECWQLIHTAEATRRHCFMTENCCYDFFALSTLEMHKRGLLGQITHCEGAYIHDLRDTFGLTEDHHQNNSTRLWMERCCNEHGGNPYPTHGIGPIGWLLDIHRGDRMDYLVSMTAQGYGPDDMLGRVNSTLIHTQKGISILLQLDVTTPRPYNRLQTVCATHGFLQKYPVPTLQTADFPHALTGEAALQEADKYATGRASQIWKRGKELGVPNEMNYTMDCRLIHCLKNGLPLDIDVYDAAEWSCLAELSRLSASQGSKPVSIPDFTNGNWNVLNGHKMY